MPVSDERERRGTMLDRNKTKCAICGARSSLWLLAAAQ
jgi:hypothetical protein